jgi:hypothetical protein
MPQGSDSRSQYLSLALFSRQIIDALLDMVRSGNHAKLEKALPSAIESLKAATDSRAAALTSVVASRVMTSYDQVRTIDDLFPPAARRSMIETLEALGAGDADPASQNKRALEAIRFFHRIENRALRNSRHSSPRPPHAPRALCPVQ